AGPQLAEADLDRVAVMILGHPEHDEVARALPVGLAELPEGSAHGVKAGRRHVDGAEAAMSGVVGCAELLGPPAGQGLALVAPREEGQLARIARPDSAEPLDRDGHRLVPADLLEFPASARADAQQRASQASRGVVIHEPGRALGAEHAPVDRMVAIALYVADPPVLQMHLDAAAAGAHVAGGPLDLVGDGAGKLDLLFGRGHVSSLLVSTHRRYIPIRRQMPV